MIRSEGAGEVHALGGSVLRRSPSLQAAQRPASRRPSAFTIIGTITSQTAVIGAVLFYFGWVRTHALFAYFGVDPTLISYGATDYILRSVNVAFPPLIGAACVALVLFGVHCVVVLPTLERANDGWAWHALQWVVLGAQALAIGLITVGIIGVLIPGRVGVPLGIALPLLLVFATITLGYTAHLQSRYPGLLGRMRVSSRTVSSQLQRTVLLTLGLLASLWAVTFYANNLGTQIAAAWAAHLPAEPTTVIYSTNRIAVFGPGVQVTEFNQPGTKYHYQYSGIRLLARSNDKFLLLPVGWQRGRDSIFAIRDDDSIRVDFIAE